MKYEFHPEALEEYRQAVLWYDEREPTLALQFIGAINGVGLYMHFRCCVLQQG